MKLFNFSKKQQPDDITNKTLLIAIEGLRTFVCSLADQHYNLLEQINKRPTNALVITDMDNKIDILKEQMNILLGEKIPFINDNLEKLLDKSSDRLLKNTSNPTLARKPIGPLSSYDNSNKSLAEMQADMATADEMVKKYIEIHEEAGPMPDHLKKMNQKIDELEKEFLIQSLKDTVNYLKLSHNAIKCCPDQKLPDPEPDPIKDINNKIEKLESKIKKHESIIAKPLAHADDYQLRFPRYKPKFKNI